jgi:hypothetical protein
MTNLEQIKHDIEQAPNLDDLRDALNYWRVVTNELPTDEIDIEIDTTSLPVFGDEPQCINEVYSWDKNRLLIVDHGTGEWDLIAREES